MEEPEQTQCGTTHYAGCDCHEQGWQNKWGEAIDRAAQLSIERDAFRMMAGELIAAIRMNSLRGTFATCSHDGIELWLKPWIARLAQPQAAPLKTEN